MKKYVKSRKKFKLFLLFMVSCLICLTIFFLKRENQHSQLIQPLIEVVDQVYEAQQQAIIPEKYNEHEVKTRIIKEKIARLTKNRYDDGEDQKPNGPADVVTKHIHIFYNLPVAWHKKGKVNKHYDRIPETNTTTVSRDSPRSLNIAFYPSMGLYKPTNNILKKHFENIKNCGVGVIIVPLIPKLTEKLFESLLNLTSNYNISVTLEINAQHNKSFNFFQEQLLWIKKYLNHNSFYKVYSISKSSYLPLVYVKNSHKIRPDEKFLCSGLQDNDVRRNLFDAIFIGHIKFKQDTDLMRRLCYDGFYTKLPSNGATYGSTWKNWSYLKAFAHTYKMLFIPTVGPGFAERNKLPRHGNIQRHRSNGRYYGVAWRTAISNHVGFISIASYNNWQEGTQIEEVSSRNAFMDYSPGSQTKYLDLTTHWVKNFLKTQSKTSSSCSELFNNTVC